MPKTPKIEVPTILFWPENPLSALLTDLNKSSLEPSLDGLYDGYLRFCDFGGEKILAKKSVILKGGGRAPKRGG